MTSQLNDALLHEGSDPVSSQSQLSSNLPFLHVLSSLSSETLAAGGLQPQQAPDLRDPKVALYYWSFVLYETLTTVYIEYEMLSELVHQAEKLSDMSTVFAGDIHPKRMLPEPYMHAILEFRYHLKETFHATLQYRLRFAGSPLCRDHYHREISSANLLNCGTTRKQSSRMGAVQQRLERFMWLLATPMDRSSVNGPPTGLHAAYMQTIGFTKFIDAFQHSVETEPEAKGLLANLLTSAIGDLATIGECLRQLELYQPWANSFDTMLTKDRLQVLRSDYDRKVESVEKRVLDTLAKATKNPKTGKPGPLAHLGAPIGSRFFYTIWRSKTEDTVNTLRKAESDLDRFWNAVDPGMLNALGNLQESHLRDLLTRPRELQRTQPWTKPTTIRASSAIPSLDTSFQELVLEHLAGLDADQQEAQHVANEHEGAGDASSTDQHPKFMLNARALKVLKTMFFTASIEGTPGEVLWTDFVYAIVSIGFAPEAMGGSVWHFHPKTVDVSHGIVFHNPHPQPKMAYWVARRYGRELTWAYGWEGSMFALR